MNPSNRSITEKQSPVQKGFNTIYGVSKEIDGKYQFIFRLNHRHDDPLNHSILGKTSPVT